MILSCLKSTKEVSLKAEQIHKQEYIDKAHSNQWARVKALSLPKKSEKSKFWFRSFIFCF